MQIHDRHGHAFLVVTWFLGEMTPLGITGHARDRFIQAAVLLHTLNPVRGEPTGYGLDQDPHDIETPRERLIKLNFLDSFALIWATKKDGDSVSAACLEEGLPQGTIIRIASNSGVRENTLGQLRELVDVLNGVASGGIVSILLRGYEKACIPNWCRSQQCLIYRIHMPKS